MAGKYKVIFTGRVRKDLPPGEITGKIAAIFKADPKTVRARFSKKGAVIVSTDDLQKAQRLAQAITRAGAQCVVMADEHAQQKPNIPAAPGAAFARTKASGASGIVMPEIGPTDISNTPFECQKVAGVEGGIKAYTAGEKDIAFGNIALVSVFCTSLNPKPADNKLLLFEAGSRRPYMVSVDKVSYQDFPGVGEPTALASLRNFVGFLMENNPAALLDDETYAFLAGGRPRLFTKGIILLCSALFRAMSEKSVPPKSAE